MKNTQNALLSKQLAEKDMYMQATSNDMIAKNMKSGKTASGIGVAGTTAAGAALGGAVAVGVGVNVIPGVGQVASAIILAGVFAAGLAMAIGGLVTYNKRQKEIAKAQESYAAKAKALAGQEFASESERIKKIQALADEYDLTFKEVEQNISELGPMLQEQVALATATLTSTASDAVRESKFGASISAIVAENMVEGESYEKRIKELTKQLYDDDKKSEWNKGGTFTEIAKREGLEKEMTGDDLHDLQVLYAKMSGKSSVDEIEDGIKNDKNKLAAEIAAYEAGKEQNTKQDDFLKLLETRDSESQEKLIDLLTMT
jgi:hypothetical protein